MWEAIFWEADPKGFSEEIFYRYERWEKAGNMKIWMNNISERGVSEWRHEVGIYGTEGGKKQCS